MLLTSLVFFALIRVELLPRVELGTSSLPRMRSTTELKQHCLLLRRGRSLLSERRDSNPRPPAWKASALSTELLSRRVIFRGVGADGFEPPKSKTADLQSAPFGHSGTHPSSEWTALIGLAMRAEALRHSSSQNHKSRCAQLLILVFILINDLFLPF